MSSSAIFHPKAPAPAPSRRWLASLRRLLRRVAQEGEVGSAQGDGRGDGSGQDTPDAGRSPEAAREMRDLLADLRRASPEPEGEGEDPGALDQPGPEEHPPCMRFGLAVDEGGEFLVLAGRAATVGHASAGLADLPLLADLEPRHLTFERRSSFHGGSGWHAHAHPDARTALDGRRLAGAAALTDGAELRLAPGVGLGFRAPDAGSASARLDLGGGLESEGAGHVLLLAPGPGGRLRIGPRTDRHVPVAGLDRDVELWEQDGRLLVRCDGGVRRAGAPVDPAGPGALVELELPLEARVDLWAGVRDQAGFPFTVSLTPLPAVGPPPAGSPSSQGPSGSEGRRG